MDASVSPPELPDEIMETAEANELAPDKRPPAEAVAMETEAKRPPVEPPATASPKPAPPFSISPASHQIILNKVCGAAKLPAASASAAGGQKLLVTAIGKSGQPIVLQLPHAGKPPGEKAPQFRVVTIGGRAELKPVATATAAASGQAALLHSQHLQAVQIPKKSPASSSAPIKFIITKPTKTSPMVTGRVISQTPPVVPARTITLADANAGKKIAISPLKSPSKVTVLSVAPPPFQPLLSASPVKLSANQPAVGGAYKTIVPLTQQGSRFTYVRLVAATTAAAPSTMTSPMTVNAVATVKQVAPKPLPSNQQRLIMPATPTFPGLPAAALLAPSYTVVPAQYVAQIQQQAAPFVALPSAAAATTTGNQAKPQNGVSDSSSRPRKPCNCTKSQCLKLYCDCFANGEFCQSCNCNNCWNNLEHEAERQKAIKTCLDRNPEAFKPKIGKGKEGGAERRHSKGCNCKRSGCLKNYCECYEARIMCSAICRCVGCKNFEESPERKTLMHLADAAEVRTQQQAAAKTKLSSQIAELLTARTPRSAGGRLPYTFVTSEVLAATCECLLERARWAELTQQPREEAERAILNEFGHCLLSIIGSAGKAKANG